MQLVFYSQMILGGPGLKHKGKAYIDDRGREETKFIIQSFAFTVVHRLTHSGKKGLIW